MRQFLDDWNNDEALQVATADFNEVQQQHGRGGKELLTMSMMAQPRPRALATIQ